MHRTALLFGLICFILAATASYYGAVRAVDTFQDATEAQLEKAVFLSGEEWVNVRANGLEIQLSGLAPDEASRFRVLETIGKFVDPSRIKDRVTILQANDIPAPKFSLEVLRSEDRVSLIGLVPTTHGRSQILDSVEDISNKLNVTDMLEEADHPIPQHWKSALDFGLEGLSKLSRSKISITPEKVIISAVTESQDEKFDFERALKKAVPDGTELVLNISAPRPVISPFTFRFSLENGIGELASCSADTTGTSQRLLDAVHAAGLQRDAKCDVGLGVPTTDWADAIIVAINAVKELKGGVLTFTDSDISLIAPETTKEADYDQIIGKLENDLPELFSLAAVLPPKPLIDGQTGDIIVPEFTATKSPEGFIQLRGRLPSVNSRNAVNAFAKSQFGSSKIYMQTRLDGNLPDGWPLRVLGGLEALAELHHGTMVVQPDSIEIRGVSDTEDAEGNMSRILSVEVGTKENFKLEIDFDEKLAARALPPSPEKCELQIAEIIGSTKIGFDPGKVRLNKRSKSVLDNIAEILRTCPKAKFEIQGHTDDSGSEELNQNLSQSRAETVLSALLSRRVLTSRMVAKGYGPSQPIADNATDEGRETNRRIVFVLLEKAQKATLAKPKTEANSENTSETPSDTEGKAKDE